MDQMNYKQFGEDIDQISFEITCSYTEIYNEQIFDLLDVSQQSKLQIREDAKKGIFLENETQIVVNSLEDVLSLIKKGQVNRSVASTNMNRESSRSHAIFTAYIRTTTVDIENHKTIKSSKLNVVDLAGSERIKDTQAEGQRLKEACKINQSLTVLGRVINFLASDSKKRSIQYVNYRESKLTHLLKDSLGGNSKTVIICTLNPNQMAYKETLSTLKFAERAKKIKNKAVVNEENNINYYKKQISELMKQLEQLKQGRDMAPTSISRLNPPSQDQIGCSKNNAILNAYEFQSLSKDIDKVQIELKGVISNIINWNDQNEELRSTLNKACKDFENYKQSSNFRINLLQSKETQNIQKFFAKFLGSSAILSGLNKEELQPLNDLISRLQEENKLLKKQVDSNPVASQLHCRVVELTCQLQQLKDQSSNCYQNDDSKHVSTSLQSKIEKLQVIQESIELKLASINDHLNEYLESLNQDPEAKAAEPSYISKKVHASDQDAEMIDTTDYAALQQSFPFARSLATQKYRDKDSRVLELANLKLKYEDQIESKNQRIEKLQSKNKLYLDIIAQREQSFKELVTQAQLNRSGNNSKERPMNDDVTGTGTSDPSQNVNRPSTGSSVHARSQASNYNNVSTISSVSQNEIQLSMNQCVLHLQDALATKIVKFNINGFQEQTITTTLGENIEENTCKDNEIISVEASLLQDMADIISQAQTEMTQYSKKIKLFQKEINSLKKENQGLRNDLDKKFQDNLLSENKNQAEAEVTSKKCRELEEQNEQMSSQINQLLQENEDILNRLSAQEEVVESVEQIKEQLEQTIEELEVTKKGLEYYENDMVPTIKKQFEEAKSHTQAMRNDNARLLIENRNLKGSIEDKVRHYENENQQLINEKEEAMIQLRFTTDEKNEFRDKLQKVHLSLNVKTQELQLKQEAFDKFQNQITELSSQLNEKSIEVNNLQEKLQTCESTYNELIVSREKVEQELQRMISQFNDQSEKNSENALKIEQLEKLNQDLQTNHQNWLEEQEKYKELSDNYQTLKMQDQFTTKVHQEALTLLKQEKELIEKQKADLQIQINNLSENQLVKMQEKLTGHVEKLMAQNNDLKQTISLKTAESKNMKIHITKLEEQLKREGQESSKLLVSNNQQAKADHFMKIKNDLVTYQKQCLELQSDLKKRSENERACLEQCNKVSQTVREIRDYLVATFGVHVDPADWGTDTDERIMKFGQKQALNASTNSAQSVNQIQSVDYALIKCRESVQKLFKLIRQVRK